MREELHSVAHGEGDAWNALYYKEDEFKYDMISDCLSNVTKQISAEAMGFSGMNCVLLENSPYLVNFVEEEIGMDGGMKGATELYRVDDWVSSCHLEQYGITSTLWNSVYLPQEKLIIADVYGDGGARPLIIDCELLDFVPVFEPQSGDFNAVELSLAQNRIDEANQLAVSETLAKNRTYADQMQQSYGIEILLS